METGIIGLPLSGKTTIFNALTGQSAETSMHTGGKKEMNIAEINVPDDRVDRLKEMFNPKKTTYATIVFKDLQVEFKDDKSIAPSSIGDMRGAAALTLVIRAFEDEAIAHSFDEVDPAADLGRLIDSMIFSDYAVIEKRMERLKKEGKKDSQEGKLLEKMSEKLLSGELLGTGFLTRDEARMLSSFSLLTIKPIIVVANTGEDNMDLAPLEKGTADLGLELFVLRGDTEMEIAQLPEEDQKDFLADLGLDKPASHRFIRHIYKSLNLMSYLTAGEDEVRAWSVTAGSTAPQAAGKIHTDLEKGFIRAEVIAYEDLINAGGFNEAKKTGKLRLEGKSYIVQDGDVMNIRFNV